MTPQKKQELKDQIDLTAREGNVLDAIWHLGEVLKAVIDDLRQTGV